MPSVLEFLPDTTTDLEAMFRRDRHVSLVKKAMDVPPHEDAVARGMFSAIGIRADVGRL
jgi:hypothetical protein